MVSTTTQFSPSFNLKLETTAIPLSKDEQIEKFKFLTKLKREYCQEFLSSNSWDFVAAENAFKMMQASGKLSLEHFDTFKF